MQIGVYGEGVIDRFLSTDGFRDVIGGSALNCAVALASAGVTSFWCGRYSSDAEGLSLRDYAQVHGVASPRLHRGSEPASIVEVSIDAAGVPAYQFRLHGSVDWQWNESELTQSFDGLSILQISSLACVLPPAAGLLPQAIHRAKQQGALISFDPNARPAAAASAAEADDMRAAIEKLVALADLVKVSDEDLSWIREGENPSDVAAAWSSQGPQLVVLTCGADGARAYQHGKEVAIVPIHSLPVIDTVGAGDTFMAWLLRGIAQDHRGSIPTDVNAITTLLQQSAKAAAITCSREGCVPPTRDEVI